MKHAEVGEEISSSEIARLAQVRAATVSNWRRRHEDFPGPVGGTAARPLFSRKEVVGWLRSRGELSPGADIGAIREDAASTDPQMGLALAIWSRLDDDATAQRMGVAPLPSGLKHAQLSRRTDYTAGYAALREHLASYPAPYPEVGRILAEKPHVTAVFAPAAKAFTAGGARGENPRLGSPRWLVDLVLALASPSGTERILDPAAGQADFLRTFARQYPGAEVRGFESDPAVVAAAMKLAAADGVRLALNNVDAFGAEAAPSDEADIVFADGVWGESLDLNRLVGDPRFPEPIGVRQRDWAWAHLAIHHLSPTGRGFLTLPAGALQQGHAKAWRNLVLQGCIEAVIALPAGLYPGVHQSFQACLLVVRKPQADSPAGVLMMSAEKASLKTDQTQRQLAAAYRAWREDETGSAPSRGVAVPITTLARSRSTLVPRRWLSPSPDDLSPKEISLPADSARQEVAKLLQNLPTAPALGRLKQQHAVGDFISINDLILGNLVQVVNPIPPKTAHTELEEHPEMTRVVTARTTTALDLDDGILRTYTYVNNEERKRIGDDSLLARHGDVIVSPLAMGGRVIARSVRPGESPGFVARTETHLRVLSEELDPDFLAMMLQARWNSAFFTGESPAKFNVRDLQIPRASLEQQREATEGLRTLDSARSQAEAMADALDRLKSAAIDAVATGRFTMSSPSRSRGAARPSNRS